MNKCHDKSLALAIVLGMLMSLSSVATGATIFDYNFENSFPSFGYSYDYAGEGDSTCSGLPVSDNEVTASFDFTTGPSGILTFDTTAWDFPIDACYTYAGFAAGIGHELPANQRLDSGTLGDYTISFDARLDGTDGLEAELQFIFQIPDQNGDGNAEGYRLGVSNNSPSNTPVPFLTPTAQSFSINLADVAFFDGAWDFAADFAQTINFQLIVQPYGNASSIGIDADNILYLDNVRLNGPLVTVITGDFDGDGDYDCGDVDSLVAGIAAGTNDPAFDLTGDGLVNGVDLDSWRAEAGANNLPSGNPYLVGDANLDGFADGSDFGIWNSNKFTSNAGWCGGDFNADGLTDGSDFGLWNANKFQSSDAATVPEPASLSSLLGLLATYGLVCRRR